MFCSFIFQFCFYNNSLINGEHLVPPSLFRVLLSLHSHGSSDVKNAPTAVPEDDDSNLMCVEVVANHVSGNEAVKQSEVQKEETPHTESHLSPDTEIKRLQSLVNFNPVTISATTTKH